MSGGILIVAKQNRIMRRFREAGATDSESAQTLEEIGCQPSFLFSRFLRYGVLVEASGRRYYMDVEKERAFRTRRKRIVLLMLGVVLALWIVLYWIN